MVPAPECSSGLNPPKPFWQGSVLLSSPPKGQAREGACQRGRIPRGTSRFANVLLESNDNPAHHGPPCLDGLHLFRTPRVLLALSLLPCQDADATGFTGCCSALQYPGALFCVLPLHRAGRQAGCSSERCRTTSGGAPTPVTASGRYLGCHHHPKRSWCAQSPRVRARWTDEAKEGRRWGFIVSCPDCAPPPTGSGIPFEYAVPWVHAANCTLIWLQQTHSLPPLPQIPLRFASSMGTHVCSNTTP